MLRKALGVAVALLLVVGVTLADEAGGKQGGKKGGRKGKGNVAMGKVVNLKLDKDGTGTIAIMQKKRGEEGDGTKVEFKITADTKFMKDASRDNKGTAVDGKDVKSTFDGKRVAIRFEKGEDDKAPKTAKTVSTFTPRKKPDAK